MTKYRIYTYEGGYGFGTDLVDLDSDYHINDSNWKYHGVYDVPDELVEFFGSYIE